MVARSGRRAIGVVFPDISACILRHKDRNQRSIKIGCGRASTQNVAKCTGASSSFLIDGHRRAALSYRGVDRGLYPKVRQHVFREPGRTSHVSIAFACRRMGGETYMIILALANALFSALAIKFS